MTKGRTPDTMMPLGVTMSLERRVALLDWAKRSGAWIVEDDYNGEYRYDTTPIPAMQGLDTGTRPCWDRRFSRTSSRADSSRDMSDLEVVDEAGRRGVVLVAMSPYLGGTAVRRTYRTAFCVAATRRAPSELACRRASATSGWSSASAFAQRAATLSYAAIAAAVSPRASCRAPSR